MTTSQNPSFIGKIGKGVGLFFLGLIGLGVAMQVSAEFVAKPMYPDATAALENLKKQVCFQLKQSGAARLQDDANGLLTEKNFDRNVTAQYRDMDCSKVTVSFTVDFQ